MRYPAFEKLEIIRLVEQSHLPARRTLDRLGIPRRTFYRWYDRYLGGGPEALQDRRGIPSLSSVRRAGRWDCSTSLMISSFSDAGYLILARPHPRSCFF